jgi:hypothetical protein
MKIFNTVIDLQQSPRLKGAPHFIWEHNDNKVSTYIAFRGFGRCLIVERVKSKTPAVTRSRNSPDKLTSPTQRCADGLCNLIKRLLRQRWRQTIRINRPNLEVLKSVLYESGI